MLAWLALSHALLFQLFPAQLSAHEKCVAVFVLMNINSAVRVWIKQGSASLSRSLTVGSVSKLANISQLPDLLSLLWTGSAVQDKRGVMLTFVSLAENEKSSWGWWRLHAVTICFRLDRSAQFGPKTWHTGVFAVLLSPDSIFGYAHLFAVLSPVSAVLGMQPPLPPEAVRELVCSCLHRDPVAADLRCSLFVAAAQNYKRDSLLRPFPPKYISRGNKDFEDLVGCSDSQKHLRLHAKHLHYTNTRWQ